MTQLPAKRSESVFEDFKKAYPLDISFNPLRLIKSFVKQIYELRIKEPLTMKVSGKDISH